MKKYVKCLSFFMAILMVVMALPITAFAAKQETYIKEIRISTASTADAAKKFLTDNGYTVVDTDLNQKTGKDYVYIGYKTTTNPDEAITDISLMQMDGGYSFSEYEAMLENKRQEINAMLDSLNVALAEARQNYADGKQEAIAAVQMLNMFEEDDSGKLLGDFMFDPQTKMEDINKVFLQGNADITSMIYNAIAMACTLISEEDNWLNKLKDVDAYGEYDPFVYNDTADYLFNSFVAVHDLIVTYENEYKEILESIDYDNLDPEVKTQDLYPDNYTNATALYVLLETIEYTSAAGTTLLDFFKQDPDELDTEEMFPILSAMTPGQRGISEFVGFQTFIFCSSCSEDGLLQYSTAVVNSFAHEGIDTTISVYYGVDRALFEDGGVALTTAALRKSASTGDDSWFEGNIDPNLSKKLHTVAGISFGIMMCAPFLGSVAESIISKTAARAVYSSTLANMCALYQIPTKLPAQFISVVTDEAYIVRELLYHSKTEAVSAAKAFMSNVAARIAIVVDTVMIAATAVMLIAEAINIGIKVYNYYHPEYDEIPKIIVSEVLTDTESYYVNYYSVKDQTGKSGDLNAWSAQKWQALYTTTDKKAGDPIIASSLVVKLKDSEFPSEEHGAVHYFGETAAANVNRYQFKKTAPATYIFYERDHSLSMTASTFSSGQLVMFTGCGLLGGVAIGSLGVIGAGKMKKKKNEKEQSDI